MTEENEYTFNLDEGLHDPKAPLITIFNPEQEVLVIIKKDGSLEYGEKYEPDESARIFWNAIQVHAPSNIGEALKVIKNAFKEDEGYKISWVANIATAYKDCERWYKERTGKKTLNKTDKHIIANESAEHFLKRLCGD